MHKLGPLFFIVVVIWLFKTMLDEKKDNNDSWTDIWRTGINDVIPYWLMAINFLVLLGFLFYALIV